MIPLDGYSTNCSKKTLFSALNKEAHLQEIDIIQWHLRQLNRQYYPFYDL